MAADTSFVDLLRDIRDVKYPDILTKHTDTVLNADEAEASATQAAGSAAEAALSQQQAAASATSASSSAQTASDRADEALVARDQVMSNISIASSSADAASASATSAANSASTATIKAGEASSSATSAAVEAGNASTHAASASASSANASAKASEATTSANAASTSAATATAAANTATTKAAEASASATSAAASAATATQKADTITNMAASAQTLTAGSPATASFNSSTGMLTLGIPQGAKGDKGDAFSVNAIGLLSGRSVYDSQPKDFSYLAIDAGMLYFKFSSTSGDWSTGIPFGKGDKGDKGDATLWRFGSIAPDNAVGLDGDLYLNTATGAVYARASGVYVLQGTLTIINDTTASTTSVYSSSKVNTLLSAKSDTTHSHSDATTSAGGFMSAADKTKLDGIATGAEVNQNAFSTIAVSGQTSVAADSKTDTLTLIAGTNVTITTDAANDTITINANDTSVAWSEITSKPTTIAGYGISDAQPLDSDLSAIAAISTNGLIAKTGAGTATTRTITAGSSKVAVTNGDGVAGNPTVDVAEANLTLQNLGGTLTVSKGGTGVATITGIVKGNGTGAMSAAVAGTDYVVPSGSITGNAGTATTLQTARTINGESFNGSANINIENRLGAAIASAATTAIGTKGSGESVHITGTTTITSLGVSNTGTQRRLIFDAALTLTHNATSLICPGAANIVTVAGTVVDVVCENGSLGYWRVLNVMHPSVSMAELGYLNGVTSAIQTQLNNLESASFTKPTSGVPLFSKVNAHSISIPVGTKVLVGTTLVTVSTTVTLSLNTAGIGGLDTGTKTAGTDYSVYALSTGEWIISASKTAPSGYTTSNSRKVGGFHYGVIPEAFTAINNITSADATKIAGINQYSFWDLKFRPICDPSGMVYIFGRWYDIYLCNTDHHTFGTSAAGKTIAGGTVLNGRNYPKIPLFYGGDGSVTYGTFTWFEAAEIAKSHSKDLISYNEFVAIAYGVLENSSASTADTGITQHLANYTSKFGICMATGCQYIWGKDVFSDTIGTYVWQDVTEGRGQVYSVGNNPKAALFGGNRDIASYSGSRASGWYYYVWDSSWATGCRFACDHLELA